MKFVKNDDDYVWKFASFNELIKYLFFFAVYKEMAPLQDTIINPQDSNGELDKYFLFL